MKIKFSAPSYRTKIAASWQRKRNPLTDADRFMLAVSHISGKRLTYAELTGKVGETTAEPF